ncbi:hypothetical protein D1818_07390 [Aquimarina sp. BL5]|uniref:hypothetical protein n=1 Tax=Aquimarina sp. BL5 TaxID=1714860 RepID=UPI000E4F436A|nr:hypothetical protein [Aquimarina sp. BL5]AXT50662.1 hypothetical protein D1818_07390 [Aquimarina sp. BL5]RKN07100.1 hypothetical protein D7036_08055 [Aquimarina sp. BL5]
MRIVRKSLVVMGLSMSALLTSCSEEDIVEELTGGCVPLSAIENYSNTLERFSNDPTVENCEAFRAASITYLNELDSCPFIEDADLEEALRDASESSCEDNG